jgi:hypothetical protein
VDEVWQAIATGPGIDSWYMGRSEVAEGIDGRGGGDRKGTVRTVFGGYTPESPITVSDPGKRFAYGTAPEPDGRFVAFDFLIEGRAAGSATLRLVTSGFLPGDDWADEFEAMTKGGALFFRTLVEYLNHFAGRTATSITVSGPAVDDVDRAWGRLGAELGLDRPAREGDQVRVDNAAGVVYFSNEQAVAVRTPDAFYRFVKGFHRPMLAMHQLFARDTDPAQAERAWQPWLTRVFG